MERRCHVKARQARQQVQGDAPLDPLRLGARCECSFLRPIRRPQDLVERRLFEPGRKRRFCAFEGLCRQSFRLLLRAHSERPHCRTAKKGDELAPSHSITSSASCWSCKGTSRPIALAVLRLITSSYLVGACTGRLAGFSPLRMSSTYAAERRTISAVSGP